MIVTLQLAGGSSYGWGDPERFPSMRAAMAYAVAFWANKGRIATPCAEDCAFRFYRCAPEGINPRDPYPDEVWTRGPRGGVRREAC